MLRILATLAAIAAASAAGASPSAGEEHRAVVVVHPNNELDELSLDALRKLWMGERTFWKGGGSVKLIAIPEGPRNHSRRVMLDIVYRMDERKYRRYWELKKFKGEAATAPVEKPEDQLAREIGDETAAIGYLSLESFEKLTAMERARVKVLKIDGKTPEGPGYPLRVQTDHKP